MSLEELYSLLSGITGFSGKVAYYCFPVNEAPELPFICYVETGSANFDADSKVYLRKKDVDIELYSETKDVASETLIEDALDAAGICWQKTEEYIDSEKCFETIYSIII